MSQKSKQKFLFTEDWQLDLLKFTIQDREGYRALNKYEDTYFTLIEHQAIAYSIKKFYKKYYTIPGLTMLKETLNGIFTSREFVDLITKGEQKGIILLAEDIYTAKLHNPDVLYEQCKTFDKYVKFKDVIEDIDVTNFDKFQGYSQRISRSLEDEDENDDMQLGLLLGDLRSRQLRRKSETNVFPTPFRQINRLTGAGGYDKGSILVIIDKQKKGKTIALVNIVRGYLRMRKKVLVIDLENGRDPMLSRLEQSIMGITKSDLLSGDHDLDLRVQKKFRKYKRLGGEVVVERMPANVTTADHIQSKIDDYYQRMGIRFDIIIIDWIGKMGSISGKIDDFGRISDAYVDVANLVEKNGFEHCWSANHITRDGMKRMSTKYNPDDIAKCIDISRHVHAIFGLNRNKDEEAAGFQRMEIVEQRDGADNGRAVFVIDKAKQSMRELTTSQRKEYDTEFYDKFKDNDNEEAPTKIVKKKNSGDFK